MFIAPRTVFPLGLPGHLHFVNDCIFTTAQQTEFLRPESCSKFSHYIRLHIWIETLPYPIFLVFSTLIRLARFSKRGGNTQVSLNFKWSVNFFNISMLIWYLAVCRPKFFCKHSFANSNALWERWVCIHKYNLKIFQSKSILEFL